MDWISGVAVYIIIWWVVIFMVLPWGVRTLDDGDIAKGHAPSAPQRPRIFAKLAVTSVVSAAVWGIVYAIIESGVISFRT